MSVGKEHVQNEQFYRGYCAYKKAYAIHDVEKLLTKLRKLEVRIYIEEHCKLLNFELLLSLCIGIKFELLILKF